MNYRMWSKVLILAIAVFFVVPTLSPAQMFSKQKAAVSENDFEIEFEIMFSEEDLQFGKLMDYDIIEIREGTCINEVGKPVLPVEEISIALPTGMKVTNVDVIETDKVEIEGQYYILPGQPPRRTNGLDDNTPFVEPDTSTYNSMNSYPSNIIEYVDQTDLAGQSMAIIQILPVQYIPGDRELILNTFIKIIIEGINGYNYGDYLPNHITERGIESYEKMIRDMVINPDEISLTVDPDGGSQPISLPPGGPYDHVIITSTTYESYWAPLAEWHTKRGLKDTVVTTSYIYSNYGGADNQEKIRNFIIDAHSTWGTQYFLMAGEHGTVPFEYRTYYQQSAPSDQYYSDYDDDWTNEVFVGRVTAEGSTQINTFIDKLLKYETDPPLSDYILDVLLVGMDADDDTEMEDLKELIDNYIPGQFTVTKVYDSHSGNHKTATIDALNNGQNIVNHADHGDWDYMGTGYWNHYWGLYNSDINGLVNNYKTSIVVSLACHPNEMDHGTDCISERFVIYNPNQAGIAFNGNTRNGWYYVGQTLGLSNSLDYEWWRGLFSRHYTTLGEIIVDSKHHFNTGYPDADVKQHCEWEFNLLGEPAMWVWTDTPESFDVTHPSTLPTGEASPFVVHVEEVGAGNVQNAYVCLWKGDEVYERGYTDAQGDVTLYPNPTTEGTMYVTVTKNDYYNNYLPYEGTAEAQEGTPPYILDGYCNYQDMSPVNDVSVEIINLESSTSWFASTVDNYYYLELQPGDDVNAGDVLRIIANDDVEWINVTDHTATQNELDIGGASIDLILNEFYLDLTDFPMYQAESPYNEMCGPAAAQMALNYMWWNSSQYPDPPMTFDDQSWLYDRGIENNSNPGDYFDLQGMWSVVQGYKPGPYSEYGYNFNKRHDADQDFMLKQICQWVNYTVGTYGGHKEGHPYHVPSLIPAHGDFTNWMAIRGIHTDKYSYPMPDELTVYGFWVNDPLPTGIGENSYKTGNEFVNYYYNTMTVGDYIGEYLAVLEPPETGENCELKIAESKPRFNGMQIYLINWLSNIDNVPDLLQMLADQFIIQAAIDGVKEQLIPYDEAFAELFEKTIPGKPMYIPSIIGNEYYAVPFNLPIEQEDNTVVVILIDAYDGSFEEASWVTEPIKYLPITKEKAKLIAYNLCEELDIDVEDADLNPELIHMEKSPYYPHWQVLIGNYGIYVSQDGTVTYVIFK